MHYRHHSLSQVLIYRVCKKRAHHIGKMDATGLAFMTELLLDLCASKNMVQMFICSTTRTNIINPEKQELSFPLSTGLSNFVLQPVGRLYSYLL
jgi:hypothetical protein